MASKTIYIGISNLRLDVKNLRHSDVSSEHEALKLLLSNESKHKVLELAADVIEMSGMDPSVKLIVTEDNSNKGQYIALEGNRRVTALKTLINPELAKGLPGYAKFKELSSKFLQLGIKDVECVVLGISEARLWIKRKHYTGMGGRGTVAWDAIASARSDALDGISRPWLSAINYLIENGVDIEPIMAGIEGKTTTVDRVLGSSKLNEVLGLSFQKKGPIQIENSNDTACLTLLVALLEDMAKSSFVESKVSNLGQQEAYISGFSNLSCKKPASSSTSTKSSGSGTGSKAASTSSSTTTKKIRWVREKTEKTAGGKGSFDSPC